MWDWIVDTATTVADTVEKYQGAIGLAVTAGTAYYAYEQQAAAMQASEDASDRALAMQQAQNEAENQANRLTGGNGQATIDVISNVRESGNLQDFMYDNETVKTSSVGLGGIRDYEKQLGIGA